MNTTALDVARTYLDLEEVPGVGSNPAILAMLLEIAPGVTDDDTPWCGAFAFEVCKRLGLPRPAVDNARGIHPARARSWLTVGTPVDLWAAQSGNDIVIFRRGRPPQPGPEVLRAPGHVAFFVSRLPGQVEVLGGNQGDAVSIARFHQEDVLGVRRLG